MATWNDVRETAPEFAERVRALFDAHRHKTMATLRRDGSPRISGIELALVGGQAVFGMMPASLKARDVRRDPRVAIHSGSEDPDDANPAAWPGDAKISGRAVEITGTEEAGALLEAMGQGEAAGPDTPVFVVDIAEVVLTKVAASADSLDVLFWKDGGLRTLKAV
ncbi:pyridoxamine 5'-phosphate oxidase family protein [Actinocorallia sp. API 0066]|uniref:pyridoxamine 5'-phosphate oxidase family protein n=1 Tax=Actinocorallia sp. API 0066 TaxID=2896846 RepID=UPI001E49B082|nr:pyridoxamine 5'-phosphate oxidase family protein [Actinocorallia sp. API 0066]MCD0450035.1 pyridoxamine 5'-phosphate oxidase family protein [Actinocorallia sp. API 0066]